MKKITCIIVALTILLALCTSAAATYDDQLVMLSELSDAEIMSFLQENNIEIPTIFASEEEAISYVRYIVEKVEQNPRYCFYYGRWALYKFAADIKTAVFAYYDLSDIVTFDYEYYTENILEDSELIAGYETWNESYRNINCYAYVIGYDHWIDPGQVYWEINDGVGVFPNEMWPTVEYVTEIIKTDLESLGYTNVSISTSMLANPTVTEHHRLIAFRKAINQTSRDFHFMMLEEDGNWYHKTGSGVPLRYKYTPSNSVVWKMEGLKDEGFFKNEDITYNSTIYYISYTIPCTTLRYQYCNNDQHAYTCTVCGTITGSKQSCSYRYKYSNNNTHILTCSTCGHTSGSAASCIYINNICKSCGHHKISGSIMKVLAEQQ